MHQYATFAMQKLSVQNIFKSTDVTLCQNEIKKECQIAAFVTLVICVKNKESKITSILVSILKTEFYYENLLSWYEVWQWIYIYMYIYLYIMGWRCIHCSMNSL